ncbi:RNA recognition motif domain-containing protein [Dyadobacter crusticola]|uniref:RNA recognition motif domain-containing protein n=1 Tax=Dyadobacter crusticola TaxID=292407 RepID=UPI0004E22F4C|nr:hypothetical protein [Dyadobacter crusticola]
MDIFVGSLSFKLKESELREAFEKFGKVSSAKIIIDKITRQSKGFGFVEMPDENEARLAINSLNGAEMYGRALVVNESQKREPRPGGSSAGSAAPRSDFKREGFNRPRPNDTDNRSTGAREKSSTGGIDDEDDDDQEVKKTAPGTSFGGGGFAGGSSFGGGDRYRSQDRKPGSNDRGHSDKNGQGNKAKIDSRYGRGEFSKKGGGGSKRHFGGRDEDDSWY